MKKSIPILVAAITVLLAASCNKKQLETTYDRQESNIQAIAESLVSSSDTSAVDRNKGSLRVTVGFGEGEALKESGTVSFHYVGYYISGSSLANNNIFAMNEESLAGSVGWSLSDSTAFNAITVDLAVEDIVEGLKNGLVGVKSGDECYVMFSGKYGFGKRKFANIPGRAALAYHLWIRGVNNN